MGTIQIKKVKKTVTTGKQGEVRQKVKNQEKQISEKKEISCEVFVNRNERLLLLQRQVERADRRSLRIKIARVKSGNCAH